MNDISLYSPVNYGNSFVYRVMTFLFLGKPNSAIKTFPKDIVFLFAFLVAS